MKKICTTIVTLSVFALAASAYGPREHSTVAYIAKQHMKPRTVALVEKLLGNQDMTYFGAFSDEYRDSIMFNGKPMSHILYVREDLTPDDTKGALAMMKHCAEELRHYKDFNDSTVLVDLGNIIHFMGDIHCPVHMDFADKRDKVAGKRHGGFSVKTLKFGVCSYHTFWDQYLCDWKVAGGVADMAREFDRCSKRETAAIQAGTIDDWAQDCINCAKDIWSGVNEDTYIDKQYMIKCLPLQQSQIRKAGYRLAAYLENIFGK